MPAMSIPYGVHLWSRFQFGANHSLLFHNIFTAEVFYPSVTVFDIATLSTLNWSSWLSIKTRAHIFVLGAICALSIRSQVFTEIETLYVCVHMPACVRSPVFLWEGASPLLQGFYSILCTVLQPCAITRLIQVSPTGEKQMNNLYQRKRNIKWAWIVFQSRFITCFITRQKLATANSFWVLSPN